MDQSTWTPRHVPGWTLHWDFGGDIGEDFLLFSIYIYDAYAKYFSN